MHCRVFDGIARPGKSKDALEVAKNQVDRVRKTTSLVFVQVLRNGDEFRIVSSWKTAKDLRAYADSEMARDFMARLEPLLVAPPVVKSFEIVLAVDGDEVLFERDEGGEAGGE
jgi:quinol monooxygenase YgiN